MKKIALIIFFFLFIQCQSLHAQQWHYYNPTLWFDVNAVAIPGSGVISVGGGWETNDSVQIMFQTSDYGATWYENAHDGLAPWNKSIAFSDMNNGYGVGYDGRIIKSDDAGMNWGWPATPTSRDLNKIFYVANGTYYVAGGNKTNDSIQTILKSTDYGNTWNVIYDTLGSWLKSLYFIDTLKGIAVGDNGVILSTTNGGDTWASVSSPLLRDFNAITFINADTGFIVGGTLSGLCRRTILQTIDGGSNWIVLSDTSGGILNDISFADALAGYAVGDSATVLKTTDGGLNWLPILIDTNLIGNETFNAVKFYNQNFGVVGGKAGVLYVYYDPFPLVSTLIASEISLNSAILNGSIDANGTATSVKFEYGTTPAYGNEIAGIPDSTSNVGSIDVYALLTGLLPNTTYHFRIKGMIGTVSNLGNDIQFYTGYPEIPNFDFEIWDSTTYDFPDGWTQATGVITKYSSGCSGNYAVKIQNPPRGTGAVTMGYIIKGVSDGTPFNARPDTLVGCFNYDIGANDTSLVILLLTKNGNLVAQNIFKIYGNSGGNFVTRKFPVEYVSSDFPDSLIMVLSCSNFFSHTQSPGTYLIADNIHFTGTSLTIPNHDFEQWHNEKSLNLVGWNYINQEWFPPDTNGTSGVIRSTDAESHDYAAKIKTFFFGSLFPDVRVGLLNSGNNYTKKFPVNARHQTFTGYYKFFPQNNDTMRININMYKNGTPIGIGNFSQINTISTYTPFVAYFYYYTSDIPDSASIDIQSYNKIAHGSSVLFIDNLCFDGFFSGLKEPPLIAVSNFDFNIYPNPFSNQATVSFSLLQDENVIVRLFDLSGKQVAFLADGKYKAGNHKLDLSSEGLQKGFYICVINTENLVQSKKLIIY